MKLSSHFFGLLLVISFNTQVSADPVNDFVDLLSGYQGWSADFKQTVTDENGQVIQASSGRLHAEKPYRLNWQADEPYPETIISNGKKLWRYDPDLEQVIIESLGDELQQAPVLIFSGDTEKIRKQYHITTLEKSQGLSRYELTPVDENSLFLSVQVTLDNNQVYSLAIVDTLGQTSTTRFDNFATVENFPGDTFHFIVPDGVDVVDHNER